MAPAHWRGQAPAVERHFRPSLAYRLCLVAGGEADATLTFRDTWEWDVAAGDIIAREAGALVTERTGRVPALQQGLAAPLRSDRRRARTARPDPRPHLRRGSVGDRFAVDCAHFKPRSGPR